MEIFFFSYSLSIFIYYYLALYSFVYSSKLLAFYINFSLQPRGLYSNVFAVEIHTYMQAEVMKVMFDLGPIPAMYDGVSFLLYIFGWQV